MEHGWENKEEEHKRNTAGKIKKRNTNGTRLGK
jgi:hypothetical protein